MLHYCITLYYVAWVKERGVVVNWTGCDEPGGAADGKVQRVVLSFEHEHSARSRHGEREMSLNSR